MSRGGGSSPDWLRLQRKIFTRWVKQKVSRVYPDIKCDDIVTDLKDGILLVRLIEVLSEKKYTGKRLKKSNSKFVCLANLSEALKFTWSVGVSLNMKPSPENLYDGAEKPILGLIWAIMLKFIKIGDDDEGEQLSAKDALLMWVQNKVNGYPGVHVKDFKRKSWENGLALCAIIHKHRPKLIDWDSLDPNDPISNFQKAIDAAYEYFGLEKYIAAEDIPKLDENSMVVYVSEYYYGIAEQRKIDLAARRIKKLIKLTKENDRLREEYNRNAREFKERLEKVEKVLGDRTIDNTLEGAKRRLEEFYQYKANDKNELLRNQLALEASFNNLSMRLVHNKRPEFVPPEGLSLKDVEAAMKRLEEREQERKVALHKELNRQLRLVKVADRHRIYFERLAKWYEEKKEYLDAREEVDSVGEATKELKILDGFVHEQASVEATSVAALSKLGQELSDEKYEHIDEVKEREATVADFLKTLTDLVPVKREYLTGLLKREEEKEALRLEYTFLVQDFFRWSKDQIESSQIHNFGFTLEDVEAYKEVLDAEDAELVREADKRIGEIEGVKGKMDEMNVVENRYTDVTVDDVHAQREALMEALAKRQEDYLEELELQRHNDELCKAFADLAGPFSEWIIEQKDKVTGSKEPLAQQLEFVEELIGRVPEDSKRLEPILEAQRRLTEAGIENNRHTTLTGKDVEVMWEQYVEFLEMKKKMLEEEIENEKLKGITKEQMREIEENFRTFDKDGSGDIDRKELTACLYSLGEERSRSEIAEIMNKYGDGNAISYENFVEFMITVFGDSDTKEEIINAFKLISRGRDYVKEEWLSKIMDDEDVEYIVSTAPKVEDGYDFVAWTEEMYKR